jgi:hypothetical protein
LVNSWNNFPAFFVKASTKGITEQNTHPSSFGGEVVHELCAILPDHLELTMLNRHLFIASLATLLSTSGSVLPVAAQSAAEDLPSSDMMTTDPDTVMDARAVPRGNA